MHNRFLSAKIALHRPDMLSLKDTPSSVSTIWTAAVKGQGFSTVVCSTCSFTTRILLQAHCSNNSIYLSLSGLQNYLNGAHNTLLNISKCCSHYHPKLSSLFTDVKRRSGTGVHLSGVHDITNKHF